MQKISEINNSLQKIMDKINTYKLNSLVKEGLNYSNDKSIKPWILLTYFELIYKNTDNNRFKFDVDEHSFERIYKEIFELMDTKYDNFDKQDFDKLFHVLAYQQFPYQMNYSIKDINRQEFIFDANNINSNLNNKLKNDFGFSVQEYFNTWRNILTKNNSNGQIAKNLLECWTVNHNEIKEKINKFPYKIKNPFFKTFFPEFFTQYPFIYYQGELKCIDSSLKHLQKKFYEFLFLQVSQNNKLKKVYDRRFQDYIDNTLKKLDIEYKDDSQLKAENMEECDFLISDFLFVECKFIKLSPLAQVNPTDTVLKNNLEYITKGYEQIVSTANRYSLQDECFGVIITYLPLYFSNANDIWDTYLRDKIQQYCKENNFSLLIEPENLFFIDIKSWDSLIEVLERDKSLRFKKVFEDAKKRNRKGMGVFSFEQHLEEYK